MTATARLHIPDEALAYILLQRTAYLRHPRHRLYRLFKALGLAPSYKTMVGLESWLRKETIKREFDADLHGEYLTIREHLPPAAKSVLDIGCGIGGIDAFIDRHYGSPPDLVFHLLDKSRVEDEVFYQFHGRAAFYNSLEQAREFLKHNGVSDERIVTLEVGDDLRIPSEGPFDLVISLISWGFHYPVDTYIEEVSCRLCPGGRLIMDIRKNTDGQGKVAARLPNMQAIFETPKFTRILAVK